MAQKAIGPNFANELKSAGLAGIALSWSPEGNLIFDASLSSQQRTAIEAVYAAHDPAKADPIAAYNAAINAGVAIVSTGTSALSGTYALDDVAQGRITAEQVYIATTTKFTNGQTARNWPDRSGALHLFPSPAAFTAFAEAAAQYVDALATALDTALLTGNAWVAPAQPVTIA